MEAVTKNDDGATEPVLSKRARKKLIKQQKLQEKKAEKKAQQKEQKRLEAERRKKEWEEKLEKVPEEERMEMIERRKERMEKRFEEREMKMERLKRGRETGVNLVIDLEFSHLMNSNEINSLCQQVILICFPFIDQDAYLHTARHC